LQRFLLLFQPQLRGNFDEVCRAVFATGIKLSPLNEIFGRDEVKIRRETEYAEVTLIEVIFKQQFGMSFFNAMKKLSPNWRGFDGWNWQRHLYDPCKILVEPAIGIGTHYAHKSPDLMQIMEIGNRIVQRQSNAVAPISSFVVPKQNLGESCLERDEDIFKIWPLNLVQAKDRGLVLDALQNNGKGFLAQYGNRITFNNVRTAVNMSLIEIMCREDDESTGEVLEAGVMMFDQTEYADLLKEYRPTNVIDPIWGWRNLKKDESLEDRMKNASEIIALAKFLSLVCKLGYVIDLMSKEAGWEAVGMCAHPDVFKKFQAWPVTTMY